MSGCLDGNGYDVETGEEILDLNLKVHYAAHNGLPALMSRRLESDWSKSISYVLTNIVVYVSRS